MTDVPLRIEPHLPGRPGMLAGDLVRGASRAWGLYPDAARSAEALEAGGSRTGDATVERARQIAGGIETSGPSARDKLDRILAGEGLLVATGQQPVLFLGPLFVLYKALSAIACAEALERRLGIPSMALFWVASDDHDWAEVGETRLPDTDNRLRSLRLEPPPGRAGKAVGPSELPASVTGLLDEISQILPSSEFAPTYLELIRGAYAPGRTMATAFMELLVGVLGERAYAWIDSSLPAVRRAAAPLYRRVAREAASVREALETGAAGVRDSGYEPGIHLVPEALPIFRDGPAGRERLRLADGRVESGEGDPVPLEAFLEQVARHPERLSPNVALRPVLTSWLLPVGATVLGPSEMAYWAQLPPLFAWAGVEMPLVRPRFSWTLIEAKVEKVLEKVDAAPAELADGGEELIERTARAEVPEAIDRALGRLRGDLGEALEEVEAAVAADLPGIRSAVGAARHGAFEVVAELEREVRARVKQRSGVLNEQIRKAALHLHPDGEPQERVFNPLYYLSRYGAGFVDALEGASRERVDRLLAAAGRSEQENTSP